MVYFKQGKRNWNFYYDTKFRVDTGNIVLTNKINLENELPTNIEQLGKEFYYHKKLYAYLYPIKQLLKNGYINTKKQKIAEGKQYFLCTKSCQKL